MAELPEIHVIAGALFDADSSSKNKTVPPGSTNKPKSILFFASHWVRSPARDFIFAGRTQHSSVKPVSVWLKFFCAKT